MQTVTASAFLKDATRPNKKEKEITKQTIEKGLPMKQVENFKKRFQLTEDQLANGLGISKTTYRKLREAGRLNKNTSEKFYHYLLVMEELRNTFQNREHEDEWMMQDNALLSAKPALCMLNEPGTQRVKRMLRSIRVGDFV